MKKTEPILIYTNSPNETNYNPNLVGKWMLFPTLENWEDWWNLIKLETEKGNLGISSKYLYNPDFTGNGVICVYTKDYQNKDDVFKVRTKLKELGFNQKIFYKTDLATMRNKYSTNSNQSWIYCD